LLAVDTALGQGEDGAELGQDFGGRFHVGDFRLAPLVTSGAGWVRTAKRSGPFPANRRGRHGSRF
jgi:hypothetical protein